MSNFTRISRDFGIVVREDALAQRAISIDALLELFEVDAPYDRGNGIVSFGPHFGEEAADNFFLRLEQLGLLYVDDFFVFSLDAPSWCKFGAALEIDGAVD